MADEPQLVIGPDGQQYQFPAGTTKDIAISYFKKKGIGVKKEQPEGALTGFSKEFNRTITGAETPQELWQNVQPLLNPSTAGPAAFEGLQGILRSVPEQAQALTERSQEELSTGHPVKAFLHQAAADVPIVGPALSSIADLAASGNKARAAGALTALALPFGEKPVGAVSDLAASAKESLGETPRGMMRSVTHTGPEQTKALVADTIKKNSAAEEESAIKNAKAADTRKLDLRKHFDTAQKIKAANAEPAAATARQSALKTGTEKLGTQIGGDLKVLDKKVRAEANGKYEAVKTAVEGETIPREALANAVTSAEGLLKGSSENIKVFRDILNKSGEEEVKIGGAGGGIKKGHPLYDQLVSQGVIESGLPATFSDLQGYYSELGEKLSTGNLPGDVYQAMRSLHTSVGDMMQQMADRRGVGPQFTEARNFYRQYMQTFHDISGPSHSGSPVAQALRAKDPKYVLQPFTGGSGDRGVQMLAKYDPALAQRLNTARGYQAQVKKTTAAAKPPKPLPTLGSKPETVKPEITKLGTAELEESKRAGVGREAERIRQFGSWIIPLTAVHAITGILTLNAKMALSAAFDIPVFLAARDAVARTLDRPGVAEWIAKPSPQDIQELMKLPPEQRGVVQKQLKKMTGEAQRQGRIVSPALLGFVAGQTAIQQGRRSNVAQALTPPKSSIPNQNKDGL